MSLLKSIGRLKSMDDLIRNEVTGNAEEFANKVGICRSMIMQNIREMKELGAEIEYCAKRRSYFYTRKFSLIIGPDAKRKVAGTNFLATENIYLSVQCHWTPNGYFRF